MTFLPIVERELRVAARQARSYWGRTGFAAATIVVAAGIYTFSAGMAPAQLGQRIFAALSGFMLVYCFVYGRQATADCLSLEKREGTLGLLFLTDLKGYDVVLGKLVGTSVRGFYALLAILPVLALPLLLGGIGNGEFWRAVLVLVDSFVFSLAIGIFGSALNRDQRRALAANMILALLFMAVPPACMGALIYFVPKQRLIPELFYSCPVYAFSLCGDLRYRAYAADYWWSIGVVHALTWLLLLGAGWIVPRTWQDRPARARRSRWREFWRAWRHGPAAGKAPFRKRLLDVNAFYWLAARARLKPVHVWIVLGCIGLWWLGGRIIAGKIWLEPMMCVMTALMLNLTLKVWLVIEAGQQLADDRRSGAFELLLTVPLRVGDIVRGQLLALRRQFLLPLLAVLGAELLLMLAARQRGPYRETQGIWLAGMFMLVIDLVALSWVGMWRALVEKNHNLATIGTLLRVLLVPWLLYGIILGVGTLWAEFALEKTWSPSWKFCLGLWTGLGLGIDLLFGMLAWWQLRTRFRVLALSRFNPIPSRLARWLGRQYGTMIHSRRQAAAEKLRRAVKPQTHEAPGKAAASGAPTVAVSSPPPRAARGSWLRPALAFCLALAVLGLGYVALRPQPVGPPAVAVSLSRSNGPVRVFGSLGGALVVLPDGSLWRWGSIGPGIAFPSPVPERIGTDSNWLQAAGGYNHIVGLRTDGTLWEWGGPGPVPGQMLDPSGEPRQVDPGHDWVSVAATTDHSVALRKDGTLWAWGDNGSGQLGIGPVPSTANPVQVGTNHDWMAVCCQWSGTMALRHDGTLWAWGPLYITGAGGMSLNNVPSPTQVYRETNWTAFASDGYSRLVRNSHGELWEPLRAPPSPAAAAASCLRLVVSDVASDRVVTAWSGEPKLYELRPGGTIRERRQPFNVFANVSVGSWRQLGHRSDWTALWGASSAVFGLTADGTLWTWGSDLSRRPSPTTMGKLKLTYTRLLTVAGGTPRPAPSMGYAPVVLKEPRPLMRLVFTNALPAGPGGMPAK